MHAYACDMLCYEKKMIERSHAPSYLKYIFIHSMNLNATYYDIFYIYYFVYRRILRILVKNNERYNIKKIIHEF